MIHRENVLVNGLTRKRRHREGIIRDPQARGMARSDRQRELQMRTSPFDEVIPSAFNASGCTSVGCIVMACSIAKSCGGCDGRGTRRRSSRDVRSTPMAAGGQQQGSEQAEMDLLAAVIATVTRAV